MKVHCDFTLFINVLSVLYSDITGSVRVLTREVLASSILQPLLTLISDPDIINQNIIWLLKNTEVIFL